MQAAQIFAWLGIFLGFITVLTFIHELGHFGVAKWKGVRVAEFSIGFGPAIFQWGKGETTFSIRWIPFGGYVSVLSDEALKQLEEIKRQPLTIEEVVKMEKKMYGLKIHEDYSKSKTMNSRTYPTKMMFIFGGVFMNFMFGWIALFTSYMIAGKRIESDTPMVVGTLVQNGEIKGNNYGFEMESYSYSNGSKTGNGMQSFWTDFKSISDKREDGTILNVNFKRGASSIQAEVQYFQKGISVFPGFDSPIIKDNSFYTTFKWINPSNRITNVAYINFNVNQMYEKVFFGEYDNMWEAMGQSFIDAWILIGQAFILLFDILTLGVVVDHREWGQAYLGVENYQIQVNKYLDLFAQLSMLLVAFNVIPLPPLDGWKATEYTYERFAKRKVQDSTISVLTKVGYIFIALVFILQFFVGWWG